MLSSEDLSAFTVVQLKEKLRTAGLPVSGRKAELIERLSNAQSDGSTTPVVVDSTPTSSSAATASPASTFAAFALGGSAAASFPPIQIEACKS